MAGAVGLLQVDRETEVDVFWVELERLASFVVHEAGVHLRHRLDRLHDRVPSGAKFAFKLTIRQLEGDSDKALLSTVFAGLKLLELDGIGGSGSRGYGKIKFTLADATHQAAFEQTQPFA